MNKKKKWGLAFALAIIFLAPTVAQASVVNTTAASIPATSHTTYSCNNGDSLSGATCTTPTVHHDAVQEQSYSATLSTVGICNGSYSVPFIAYWNGQWKCAQPGDVNDIHNYSVSSGTTQSYTCPSGGDLVGTTCITIQGVSASTTGGSTYSATPSTTYSCPSNQSLNGQNCEGNGSSVFNTNELATTAKDWITSHVLPLVAGLVALAIAIRLSLRAVRKYAKVG